MSAILGNSLLIISRLFIIIPKMERFNFNKALKIRNSFIVEIF